MQTKIFQVHTGSLSMAIYHLNLKAKQVSPCNQVQYINLSILIFTVMESLFKKIIDLIIF